MEKPLVSIIIPCYNYGHFLANTLESVCSQTYARWEAIIIDDGSTDNTRSISMQYVERDGRIKYAYQDNRGLAASRNAGIRLASGSYILPVDADDLISREYVGEAVGVLESDAKIGIVYSKAQLFGALRGEWRLPPFSIERFVAGNIIFCSAMFRRSDWEIVGGFKEGMKYGFEDWEFWLSLLEIGVRVHKIDRIHFFYRVGDKSMARTINRDFKQEAYSILYSHHKNFIDQHTPNHLALYEEYYKFNLLKRRFGKLFKYIERYLIRF